MIEGAGSLGGDARPESRSSWPKHFKGRVLLEVLAGLVVVETLQFLFTGLPIGAVFLGPLMRPLQFLFESSNILWGGKEIVGILLVLLVVRIVDGGNVREITTDLGLAPPLKSLLPAIAIFVPLAVGAFFAGTGVADPYQGWASPQHYAAMLVAAFFVELLYRGYFFGHLVKHGGWRWPAAAVLTSVLFVLFYLTTVLLGPSWEGRKLPSVTWLVLSFLVCFLLCGAYVFTQGNLYACVGLRLAWMLTINPPAAGRIPLYTGAALALVLCAVWFGLIRRGLPRLTEKGLQPG